ncbi:MULTISPECIES: hypothetical protein [unclassified Micromonospora]|uniref:hypothetical protein n=1 Tax=unclassified Micromonospora TaxID=2617518 RepID=UPI003A88291B
MGDPPVGRPHVLPLPTAVIAVLFGLRHNLPGEVLGEVLGCSQATITRHHQILRPILRWVTRPEVDQRLDQAHRDGVLVDGFVAPVGEREDHHGPFSGKKHMCGQNVQVPTADELDPTDQYIVDGTLLPCWSWRTHRCLYSGKHKTTGMSVQVARAFDGALAWVCDPVTGNRHDSYAINDTGSSSP